MSLSDSPSQVPTMTDLLIEAAEEIEAGIRERYGVPLHPAYEAKFDRDMDLPNRLRTFASGSYVLSNTETHVSVSLEDLQTILRGMMFRGNVGPHIEARKLLNGLLSSSTKKENDNG